MKVDFRMVGDKELERALAALPNAVSRSIQIAALKAGAEPIRAQASSLAPRSDDAPHMADAIVVSVPSQARLEARGIVHEPAVVDIGPSTKFFYGFFQEIGTAFHGARAFMRPAFDANWRRSMRIIGAHAWAAIRKRIGKGGGPSSTRGTL